MNEDERHCGNCYWVKEIRQKERQCRLTREWHERGYVCEHWSQFSGDNEGDRQREADEYVRRIQDKEIADKELVSDEKVREEDRKFQRMMAWVDQIRKAIVEIITKLLRPGGSS